MPSMPDAAVTTPRRRLRLVYAAGPGDVVGTFRHWKEGRDDPSQVAITYSGQFYELCRELGAEALVVSHCPRRDASSDETLRVMNRPAPFHTTPGPLYMLGQVFKGLWVTAKAVRFGAQLAAQVVHLAGVGDRNLRGIVAPFLPVAVSPHHVAGSGGVENSQGAGRVV